MLRTISRPLGRRYQSNIATQHLFTAKSISESVPTHQLLQDLGFIYQPSAGLIHWLPLGLKVLRNVENIIRQRMNEIDGEEFSLSSISSKDLWSKTGRWGNTELFKLNINSKQGGEPDFCLGPTHEEEITNIIKGYNLNYKNLPVLTYQISRKYRFEKRPRGGLLRGREFLMKDAYSFDKDYESAMKMYKTVNDAYWKIFQDLKVPFVRANADSGDIGGSLSQEWHYVHKSGEDLLFKCDHCGEISNVEKTVSLPDESTPMAKEANVSYLLTKDKQTLVCAYYPKDREFVPNFLKEHVEDLDVSTVKLSPEEIMDEFIQDEDELMVNKSFIRVMDIRIDHTTDLPDFPISKFQKNRFSTLTDISIVEAKEDEYCESCETGKLKSMMAIEVGHTFYLGKRYSEPLSAKFTDSDNKLSNFEMGCYGIGVSRIVAAISELSRDEEGLIWPSSISPYDISLIEAPKIEKEIVDEISGLLKKDGLSILFDKRSLKKVGFGAKMVNARMLGIPIILVIGKHYPIVEIEVRGKRWESKNQYDYEILHSEVGESWNWEIQKDKYEKHLVHKDHVSKVIKSLLKDL